MKRDKSLEESNILKNSILNTIPSNRISNGILVSNLPKNYDKKLLFDLFIKSGEIEQILSYDRQIVIIYKNTISRECSLMYNHIKFANFEKELQITELENTSLELLNEEFINYDIKELIEIYSNKSSFLSNYSNLSDEKKKESYLSSSQKVKLIKNMNLSESSDKENYDFKSIDINKMNLSIIKEANSPTYENTPKENFLKFKKRKSQIINLQKIDRPMSIVMDEYLEENANNQYFNFATVIEHKNDEEKECLPNVRENENFENEEEMEKKFYTNFSQQKNGKIYIYEDLCRDNILNTNYLGKIFGIWLILFNIYTIFKFLNNILYG